VFGGVHLNPKHEHSLCHKTFEKDYCKSTVFSCSASVHSVQTSTSVFRPVKSSGTSEHSSALSVSALQTLLAFLEESLAAPTNSTYADSA
jgi:hypothetical protein